MTARRRNAVVLTVCVFAATSLLALPARAAVYIYGCILNPRQEVPTIPAGPLGAGRFVIDTDANTVTYRITFSGLTSAELSAHIHGAAGPGVNATVLTTLPAGNPKVGVWTYPEVNEADILAGRTYANIHTINNPGGEMRGQIVKFNALLDAAQEVPPNITTGKGWLTAMADTVTNTISYYMFYEGLTGAPLISHFHGNALHGTSTGVKVTLPVTASPMTGTVGYAQGDEAALLAGQFYANIHTAANPGGEIRGQMVPLVIPMDTQQEVPPIGTAPTAAGFGMVAIDTFTNVMSFDVRVVGLSSAEAAAHIHAFAAANANAGVVQPMVAGPQKLGTWAYGAANETSVLSGLQYFNVHTVNNGGGEIRGQITNLPGSGSVLGVGSDGPRMLSGLSAAPNPFGGRTLLTFQLTRTGSVQMSIVGVDGRIVRREPATLYAPGPHTFEWDGRDDAGRDAPPGVYFATVRTPDGERTTRIARLR